LIETKGTHIVVELSFCNENTINNLEKLKDLLVKAAKKANATIKASYFFDFGEGISGFLVLAQSHLSIHTWPKNKYVALDIYTCGDTDPEKAVELIIKELECKKAYVSKLERGIKERNFYLHSIISKELEKTK